MIQIADKKYVYLIGIGGIGMSALARYFKSRGAKVAGYDIVETELTQNLRNEGVDIHYQDDVSLIHKDFLNKKDALIIYTPAIPNDHKELNFFRDGGFLFLKRAKVLGLLSKNKNCLAVSGTHGKTSISTMLSYLLTESGIGCNAFLGGISKNFNSNHIFDPGSETIVVEADEYDRSFLNLFPNALLISAIDPDHLEVYGDRKNIVCAFNQLVEQIEKNGNLVVHKNVEKDIKNRNTKTYTYSLDHPKSDFHASAIQMDGVRTWFNFHACGTVFKGFSLTLPGMVNVENAIGTLAMAFLEGASLELLREIMPHYKGVRRRFDYQINTPELVYLDDYAHHPAEMEALINALRDFYTGRNILGIFQPHLFTRTRDFAGDFAEVLDKFDEAWLMDIYPARETPLPGVHAELVLGKMKKQNKEKVSPEGIKEKLQTRKNDIVVTIGAGDIDRQVPVIKDVLQKYMNSKKKND